MDEFTPEERKKNLLLEASSEAVHRHLGTFAVAMFDLGKPNVGVGSGTLINVYGHLLVATAEHCVPARPNSRLWLLTSNPRKPSDGMISFIKSGVDHEKDVAFLELDPTVASSYFGDKQACPIDRVKPVDIGRTRALVSLIGSPGDRVDTSRQHEGLPTMVARVDGYTGIVLSHEDWKVPPGIQELPDQSIHVAIDYPKDLTNLQTNASMKAYHPGGFSGGGIWDQHISSEGVWSPQKATLFALLSYWYGDAFPDFRNLFGIQIIHWLRLVHKHYPELRSNLDSQFPEISNP